MPAVKSGVLLFIEVFAGHVVFGHLTGAHLPNTTFAGVFNAGDYSRLERVSLLDQLVHTFRIRRFQIGQTLKVTRLPA